MKFNARIILTVFLLGMLSFCSIFAGPALADLVDDGKALLLEEYDLYGADAKFAEALTLNAADLRANFWRALTIGMTNPDFKAELTRVGFLDAESKLPLDAENEFMLGYSIVDTMIIDNTDTGAGYSEEGSGWSTSTDESSYGDSCRRHAPGTGENKAVWTFTIATAGEYDVALWWPHRDDNCTDARFTVYYDGGNQTIVRTQQGNGGSWQHIGKFHFSPGADARVEISDNITTGNVVADAVKLEFNEIFLDADAAHASFIGSWSDVVYGYAKNGSYKEIAAGTGGSCTWTLPVTLSGRYHLEGRWFATDTNATNAVYEIRINGSLVSSIPVNQQHNNLDSVSLGLFEFQAGDTNTVTLLQNSSGKVTSDGISIIPIRTYTNLTQFQNIQSSSLTQLDQALGCLNNVTSAFADTADFHAKDDLGNPVITELDYGDALMLKAVLNLYKSEMCRLAAYNFDNLDAHKLGASYSGLFSINSLLSSYPNLLNLSGGASSYMSTAKQAIISSFGSYYDAYNFITAEGDSQEDDFITFDSTYQEEAPEALHPILDKIVSNLNGSTSYFFVTPEDFESDPDESYFETKINYRAYYDNPTGLRSLLPQFDADDNVLRGTAPDPTLGGILPDFKQEDYNGMAKLGSRLFQPKVNWSGESFSITLDWKLDTYPDFVRYKIFRSTTASVDETSSLVYDSTNINTLTVTDTAVDQNQSIYYYRLYTYYSDGDKSASLMRRVVTKIYVNINNSTGTEDGTKQYPFSDLGDAIDDYGTSGAKIIVAQGTYPEYESSMHLSNKSGLIIEGGYEPVNWARNIQTYATVIDGTGRGGWGVIGLYNQSNIVIDGFTVMGDQVNVINLSNATLISIKNCTIRNSSQVGIGAWSRSSLIVEDCIITQNQGDGIRISDGVSLTLKRSNILDNNGSGLNLENATANKWYEVYGGNTYISGPDGYDPASHGYTFLGSDIFTQTYSGTYDYYIIRTPSGNPVMVDTVQGSTGSYYATYTTGNTSEYWNVGGAPDGAYATIGNNDYNYPGGYILIDPVPGNTSLKVFVVDAPAISCPITVENNVITGNNSYGIRLRNTLGQAVIKNNLIVDNDIFGIGGEGKDTPVILNNTIIDNGSWGIAFGSGTSSYGSYIAPVIKNNIITGQSIEIHFENSAAAPLIDYNDVYSSTSSYSGCSAGAHDINADPLFTTGNPKGDYYLSQIPAGQLATSPCVDAGSDTSASQALDTMTTRTDDYFDTGTVDMGYHYASEGIIVDNTDSAHTSTVGTWTASSSTAGYYGTNYQYRVAGTGVNKFTWSPVIAANGTYEVFARWTSFANRASNAKFTITNSNGFSVAEVNQQVNGGVWVSLGEYSFTAGGTAQVTLTDNANGVVIADAVKLVYLNNHGDNVVDNADSAHTSAVGSWTVSTSTAGYYASNYQYRAAGTGANKFTWSPVIDTNGTYEIYARWTASSNRATNAKYTITNHTGSTLPVEVNQQLNNGAWVSLGKCSFTTTGTAQISLSDNANGYVIADAVKLVYLNNKVDTVVDNADSNTSTVGSWTVSSSTAGYYAANYQLRPAGTGVNKFTWSPVVAEDGTYEVFARWTAFSNRASNAKYTITNHTGNTVPIEVNQQLNNGVWISLGKHSFTTTGTAQISLSDNANGYVIADAVKLVYVNSKTEEVVDNTDSNTSRVGTWTVSSSTAGYYGSNYQYRTAGTGANKFTWSPVIATNGTYEVFARWTAFSNRANNAKYTITNNSGSSTVEVNQQLNNGAWVSLGKHSFTVGGTAQVSLNDNATGVVIADAIRVVLQD